MSVRNGSQTDVRLVAALGGKRTLAEGSHYGLCCFFRAVPSTRSRHQLSFRLIDGQQGVQEAVDGLSGGHGKARAEAIFGPDCFCVQVIKHLLVEFVGTRDRSRGPSSPLPFGL